MTEKERNELLKVKQIELEEILLNMTDEKINTLEFPICIPTIKNRKPSIIDHLEQFGNTEIYLFIYDFDKENYDYIKENNNLKKVIVPDEYLSIQKMRCFIQNYMKDRIHWQCDDDLWFFYFGHKKKHILPSRGMKIMELRRRDDNFSIIGPIIGDIRLKKDIMKKEWCNTFTYACMLVNNKVLKMNDCMFTDDTEISEDYVMYFNSYLKGIPIDSYFLMVARYYFHAGSKNTTASGLDKRVNFLYNTYIKYGEFINPYISTDGQIKYYINYYKLKNKNIEYNNTILDFCKNHDYLGLYKYLFSNCMVKHTFRNKDINIVIDIIKNVFNEIKIEYKEDDINYIRKLLEFFNEHKDIEKADIVKLLNKNNILKKDC